MTALNPKLLKAIDERLDELVEMTEQIMEQTKVYGRQCPECKQWYEPEKKECDKCRKGTHEILEEHQLRNLENLANATDSVKVLELFVRYQMGRHSEWRHNNFGNQVIEDFRKLREMAKGVAQGQEKVVHLHLIRLYLGFLVREFVARRPRE
ncbi:MAG: hypothetical protein NZ805_02475 [Armatimonadetes bacterium]|nr:hypothetical protein [Armatimonadota bacterium]MDW8028166.1 hypothetical protein [Armatimonadota bacterium]